MRFFSVYDSFPTPQFQGQGLEIQNKSGPPETLQAQKISAPWDQNWGRYWGSKIFLPRPPQVKISICDLPIFAQSRPRNGKGYKPSKFLEKPQMISRDISRFICYPSAQYRQCKTIRTPSQFADKPTCGHKLSLICRGGDLRGTEGIVPLIFRWRGRRCFHTSNVQKMSLQIVTVKEIHKERNRRYDTSDRHTSLFYRAIDLYASTYYDSVQINLSLLLFLLSVVLATKTDEMYEYLYQVYQLIKSIDQFIVTLAEQNSNQRLD